MVVNPPQKGKVVVFSATGRGGGILRDGGRENGGERGVNAPPPPKSAAEFG